MPPEEVGEKVLRAIRRNDYYIFTHPEFRDGLREAAERASGGRSPVPPPPVLTPPA